MSLARLLLLTVLPALAGVAGEVAVAGAGPRFEPRQRTAAVRAAGQAAELECRVLNLHDKAVSWVRTRDLQILSHAGAVFTADPRVAVRARSPAPALSAHTLRLERLRPRDSGRYECQLNTEPKSSLYFNLTVLDEPVPAVVVWAEQDAVHGTTGGTATLRCGARYEPEPRALPMPPLDLRWSRVESGDESPSARDVSLGARGVSLDTERWAARVLSRLTLAQLAASDAGLYMCASAGHSAGVRLMVDDMEERMEMQRDAASGAPCHFTRRSPMLPLLVALCVLRLLAAV